MNHDSNNPNTIGIKIGLPNSSNKGFDIKAGSIESAPNTPYNPNNNLKLYDSKDRYSHIPSVKAIVCYINCDGFISNPTNNNDKQSTIDSNSIFSNIESTNKPFNYKDSHITAKEIIDNDNTSTLVLESKTNLLEYQGGTADTLIGGLSGVFASMATLAEKYGLDEAVKKASGAKGRILASVLFQTQGASVSLAYNYGNNGRDMVKAMVNVGIELGVSYAVSLGAGAIATALSAPVWALVAISALAAVGVGLLLNTNLGKWAVNGITENLVKPLMESIDSLITSLQSKLQSFFSLFKSNPNAYELVSNPNLESKDYQSLIELLLDKNSTAKDIDSLLHSFPHYLQDSKQNLESTNTQSTQSAESTTPTTKAPKATKETTDSKTLTPNNNQTPNTFPFQLAIKDYNTFAPLQNKTIQLTNIDSKQLYTQTTDSRGYVSFNIKESERGDFFSIIIIHKDYNLAQHNLSNNITQRTICPHSYTNHTAIVYFKQNNTQSQDNTNLIESIQFIEYIEWGLNSPQQIKIDYISNKQDDITYPLNYPFAPGTYIELEAKLSDNIESSTKLQWGYIILHNDIELQSFRENKKAYKLQYINDESKYFHTHNIYNKIGFYLPLQKCAYIIVFASTSEIDIYKDIYLIINTDFKVGLDSNNGVIESKRETQKEKQNYQTFSKAIDMIQSKMPNNGILAQSTKESLPNWNALNSICTLQEAVWFLQANNEKLNELYQNNQARYMQKDSNGGLLYDVLFDYYRIYPSLASKIAYIYYRFDVADEKLVEGVEQDSGKYREDRDISYIKSIVTLFDKKQSYLQSKTFLQRYKEIFYTNNPNNAMATTKEVGQRKHFIEYLVFKIIETLGLSYPANFTLNEYTKNPYKDIVVFFQEDIKKNPNGKTSLLSGYVQNQTIHFNILAIEKGNFTFTSDNEYYPFRHAIAFEYILNTIFHEIRHFYIKEKYTKNEISVLKRYIYCSNYFYINTSHHVIFDKFFKKCFNNDLDNVGCMPNNYQNAYEIQPNERDPRYVAHQIMKELKEKGL